MNEAREAYCRSITALLWEYIWPEPKDGFSSVDTSLKKRPLSPKEWKLIWADLDHRVRVLEKSGMKHLRDQAPACRSRFEEVKTAYQRTSR